MEDPLEFGGRKQVNRYITLSHAGLHYKALPRLCELGSISCVLFTNCWQESAIL